MARFIARTVRLARAGLAPALAGIAMTLTLAPAGAQTAAGESANRVAANTDWAVFVDGNPADCWGVSGPKETKNTDEQGRPKAVKRGDILLFVTFHKGKAGTGEVSFTGGYPFAKDSMVSLDVGGTVFELFTKDEWAWTGSPEDDAKIVATMKAGSTAILKARSSRGTVTTDTFSLLGFTAALEEASKRCK